MILYSSTYVPIVLYLCSYSPLPMLQYSSTYGTMFLYLCSYFQLYVPIFLYPPMVLYSSKYVTIFLCLWYYIPLPTYGTIFLSLWYYIPLPTYGTIFLYLWYYILLPMLLYSSTLIVYVDRLRQGIGRYWNDVLKVLCNLYKGGRGGLSNGGLKRR